MNMSRNRNRNTHKLIHARMLTSMAHMCGYTDTGPHIHPQWSNTWMSARTCVHDTHTHTHTNTRVCACIHTHTRVRARIRTDFEMHTSNVKLSARREAEWRYIIKHPVCLVFIFEKKKKGRKTNLFTKFDTNLYPSSPFLIFFFTVVSGQPLRSYTPCNQVYKRGQQSACTHWSTTACDVIRHPKTMLAKWSI